LPAVIALLILSIPFFVLSDHYRYFRHGVRTTATISDLEGRARGYSRGPSETDPGHTIYEQVISYEYSDEQGDRHLSTYKTESSTFLPYRVGDVIHIQYLDNDPDVSRPLPSWWAARWGLLIVCLVGGAGLVGLALWQPWTGTLASLFRGLGNLPLRLPGKTRRRALLLHRPLPHAWLKIIRKNVALHSHLTLAEQEKLHGDLQVFIEEKTWEGCGGMTITDEVKVTISAQACILLLGIDHDYYGQVKSILVYPSAFALPDGQMQSDGLVHEGMGAVGQAVMRGPVILAWDDVLAGGRNDHDGKNVVFHEFAHQLDFHGEWGSRKGQSATAEERESRQQIMTAEYAQLARAAEDGRATLLDKYGATNPTEFFAVATECFFEQPVQMQRLHPQLYEVLQVFYGQDPAKRFARSK
jgi:Mlc titration factor MtfA (ptsG expression regulator)